VESSGYSASYLPENVRVNQPNDQASRWSSAANDQNQFLLLKLDRMALLEAVSFGKFHKGNKAACGMIT
jgi:muskelin